VTKLPVESFAQLASLLGGDGRWTQGPLPYDRAVMSPVGSPRLQLPAKAAYESLRPFFGQSSAGLRGFCPDPWVHCD